MVPIYMNYTLQWKTWRRHQMETFSALLAFVRGIHRSPVNSLSQSPVMRSFDVFFDLRLNKQLSKQSWGWWFETPPRPLWRHCNACSAGFIDTVTRVWSPHNRCGQERSLALQKHIEIQQSASLLQARHMSANVPVSPVTRRFKSWFSPDNKWSNLLYGKPIDTREYSSQLLVMRKVCPCYDLLMPYKTWSSTPLHHCCSEKWRHQFLCTFHRHSLHPCYSLNSEIRKDEFMITERDQVLPFEFYYYLYLLCFILSHCT